jgi:hypothetical protein
LIEGETQSVAHYFEMQIQKNQMLTKEIATEEFEAGRLRFSRLLSASSDTLIIVLKGHLLIEEQLQAIIEAAVTSPRIVREARLTFSQRLKLAQAIAGHFSNTVVWEAAEALNSARNKWAHVAEPATSVILLQRFFQLCDNEPRFEAARSHSEEIVRLYEYISHIWIILDALHDVVRICREKMPLP